MRTSKSIHLIRSDISTRIHILILYLLLAIITILSTFYFIYFSRLIQSHNTEFHLFQQRLSKLEAVEIIISSSSNLDDPSQRRSRHTRIKSKLFDKQQEDEEGESVVGAIHFKVPVRSEESD